MSPPAYCAVDIGMLTTKTAVAEQGGPPEFLRLPSGTDPRASLSSALAQHQPKVSRAGTASLCLAVPDGWLAGGDPGAHAQESLRHVVEDQLGLAPVTWVGQLAAVTVLAAHRGGFATPGRYLACDVGAAGVRAAAFDVTGREVTPLAWDDVEGSGGHDLAMALRSAMSAQADPALDDWFVHSEKQGPKAQATLRAAREDPAFREAVSYSFVGRNGRYRLEAGQVIDAFAPTSARLVAAISAVLGAGEPTVVAMAGGLTWFPPIASTIADVTGAAPLDLGPHAAVHGALMLARGDARIGLSDLGPVTLPMHQVKNGLLEEVSMPLPWTWSFSTGDLLDIPGAELILNVGGQLRVARIASPGPHWIGVRPAWSGGGSLVLRPEGATTADAVYIRSLDDLEAAR